MSPSLDNDRAERRRLTRAYCYLGALAGLVAAGLLAWLHRANARDAGDPSALALALGLGVGAVYYAGLGVYAGVVACRLGPETAEPARRRLRYSVLALLGPIVLVGLLAVLGLDALEDLGYDWGSGKKRRPDR